jgi:hypothetical protein
MEVFRCDSCRSFIDERRLRVQFDWSDETSYSEHHFCGWVCLARFVERRVGDGLS